MSFKISTNAGTWMEAVVNVVLMNQDHFIANAEMDSNYGQTERHAKVSSYQLEPYILLTLDQRKVNQSEHKRIYLEI